MEQGTKEPSAPLAGDVGARGAFGLANRSGVRTDLDGCLGEDFGLRGGPAQVPEPQPGQDQEHDRSAKGHEGGDQHDLSHLPPPVGVQQQPAQRLTAALGLHLPGESGGLLALSRLEC